MKNLLILAALCTATVASGKGLAPAFKSLEHRCRTMYEETEAPLPTHNAQTCTSCHLQTVAFHLPTSK